MKIDFIEFVLDWPSELSVFDLRNYILSNLRNHGEPLRWAITSLTNYPGKTTQKMSIEAVFIINKDKKKDYLRLI